MLAYPTEPKVRTPDQKLAACIAVICSFAAIGPLATNIFLPSLPAIAADLHITSATVAATISVFLAIFAVGQLIVGPLSDRFGRRIPILTGLCIFVVGTIWCALASDLASLLVARSIQACGACTATVLSRAIARDLFDGQALAKVLALTTVATAAAPGLSPLLGSALDHFFGWRSEFAFVAIFAVCALLAYAALIGETNWSANGSVNPVAVGASYLGLIRDARFVVPARTAGLLIAGLFAVFSAAPRVLLEHFRFSPVTLGLLFAGVVVVVFGASMLAPRLSARFGLHRAMLVGLGVTATGGVALLFAVLLAKELVSAVSPYRSCLRGRRGHCKPAVGRGGPVAVRRQGRNRGSLVWLRANGGGGMRRAARCCPLKRSGARARDRAGTYRSACADPARPGGAAFGRKCLSIAKRSRRGRRHRDVRPHHTATARGGLLVEFQEFEAAAA